VLLARIVHAPDLDTAGELAEIEQAEALEGEQRRSETGGVLRLRELVHRRVEDIGHDLRPRIRLRAAAIVQEMAEAAFGEAFDGVAQPGEVHRDALEDSPGEVSPPRLHTQVQEAAAHACVGRRGYRTAHPGKKKNAATAGFDRLDDSAKRLEAVVVGQIAEFVGGIDEVFEEVFKRAAAHAVFRHDEVGAGHGAGHAEDGMARVRAFEVDVRDHDARATDGDRRMIPTESIRTHSAGLRVVQAGDDLGAGRKAKFLRNLGAYRAEHGVEGYQLG